jgi:predicted O-methyltransferase YrrM
MDFLPENLQDYIEAHTEEESALLQKINRDTHVNVLMPRMLSGHLQGRVLSMISHMIKPSCVLEIGTYTGYSTICLAEGMSTGGDIVTIDVNEELEERVRRNFEEAKVKVNIDYRVGNAIEVIPTLDRHFDLVFIDADKMNYSRYFDLIIDKVVQGGYILADNVLWSGKVIEEDLKSGDKDTKGILEFNEKVHHDTRVCNVLFPIRDGIMVLRKL